MAERDTRFGGNIERANRGIPYPTGGRDVRFEGSLPHKFQYLDQGRTVVSDTEPAFTDMGRNRNVPFPQSTGTPNFRPPYGAPGQPSYNQWKQQIDPYSNQMRSRTPSDIGYDRMGGGLGGLEEQAAIPNWYKWYDKLINRFGEQKGSELWHQYASDDTGIGSTNEYQMAELIPRQKEWIRSMEGTPDFRDFDSRFDIIKGMENKPWDSWLPGGMPGAQEPTTEQEVRDEYDYLEKNRQQLINQGKLKWA